MSKKTLLIGITTVNGPDRVFACLKSIRETFPPKVDYELLVVDDGSDPRNSDMLKIVCTLFNAEYWCHADKNGRPTNRGIPAGWNTIAETACNRNIPFALISNDDIQYLDRAIDDGVEVLKRNDAVVTVGLSALFGTQSGLTRSWPEDYPQIKPVRVLHSIGCSFMVRTIPWRKLGGWDEQFISHFEDVDFGVRLNQAGGVAVNIPVTVLHDWSKTFKENPSLFGHLRLETSRRLFLKKHGKTSREFGSLPTVPIVWRNRDGAIVTDQAEYRGQ